MDKKEQIIIQAFELFMKNGIKSMTMDDIAKNMAISKKTLYQYFSNKDELVNAVLEKHIETDKCNVKNIFNPKNNAIDDLMQIATSINETLKRIHPSIHYDLEKYHPTAWKKFGEYKRNFIYENIKQNILKGIQEGLYRSDINPEIIATLYVSKADVIFDASVFAPEKYAFNRVYLEMLKHHIRGIATKKGLKYLDKKLKSIEELFK
ncbi:MAG: TetR/AcrR family transcriptional regulator [Bacteroidia bacterium]